MTEGKADSQTSQEAIKIAADAVKDVVTEALVRRHGELHGKVVAFAMFGGGGVPGLLGDALIVARLGLSGHPAEAAKEIVAEAATDALEEAAHEALAVGLEACGIEVAAFVANIGLALGLVLMSKKVGDATLPPGLAGPGLNVGPTPDFPAPAEPRTNPESPRPAHGPRGPAPDAGPLPSPRPAPSPNPPPGGGPESPDIPDFPVLGGPRIPPGPTPTPGDGPESPEEPPSAPPPPAPEAPPPTPEAPPPPPPPPPAPEPTPIPDEPEEPQPPIPMPMTRQGPLVHPPEHDDLKLRERLERGKGGGAGGGVEG